ncbi:rRNA maturation RNase YbeY [Daejeonella sp.]|uniref:rRNA maturation RNase YbeY n=1 Tax=Daejeonella sp. TaxID=2805397 RepID=UPI0030C4D0FE
MPQLPINFFIEDISFNLKRKILLRKWVESCIKAEGYRLRELNFIFCSDNYLLGINQEYLKHDTFTDIITFDNSEDDKLIAGDIFISVDRVNENAISFKVSRQDELHRVMIHGTLHLLGYPDKGKEAKAVMTKKENYYLANRAV